MSDLDLKETEVIERLTKKLQKMGSLYKNLMQENETLKAEVSFYKSEAQTHGKRFNENRLLKDKQKKAIIRIEKLLKRINSLQ